MSSLRGDPAEWLPGLLDAGEVMLKTLIPQAWVTLSLHGFDVNCHEDQITNPFVRELWKARRDNCPEASFRIEAQYMVNPAEDDTGKVDIAVTYGGDQGLYLAYECKWLERGDKSSKARLYLGKEGLGRFLSRKYASAMPVGYMVGYVASGDLDAATTRLHGAMQRKGMPQPSPTREIAPLKTFTTDHRRSSTPISITHILLPC